MLIKILFTVVVLPFLALFCEKKETVFTHALIYRYETLTEKGEFWLYHNPETGSILFVPEDEMIDFVVADTLGNYYFFGDNGHGEKVVTSQHIDWVTEKTEDRNRVFPQSDYLITFEALSQKRYIPNSENQQQQFECKGFKMLYNKVQRQQNIYITEDIPLNSYQVYGFNRLQGDIRLPVPQLDMIGIVSEKQLVTHIENDIFKLEFIAYEYNPFELNTKKYKILGGK